MAKTIEDKKRKIFSYLDKYSKKANFFALTSQAIHKKFDKEFGEKVTDDIVQKLLEEENLEEEEIGNTIYFPTDNKKVVSNRINSWFKKNLFYIYFIITIVWFYTLTKFPIMLDYLLKDAQTKMQIFSTGFIISFITILLLSKLIHLVYIKISGKSKDVRNMRKEHKFFIFSGVILIVLVILTQIYYPNFTTVVIGITSLILAVISYIINKK